MFLGYFHCMWCHILLASFHIAVIYCEGWTWLGGDQIVDGISTERYPGGRSGASTWDDVSTNLTWMFGGQGFSNFPSGKPHLLNDLWQFNPESKNRTEVFVKLGPAVFNNHRDRRSDSEQELKPWPAKRHHASMCGFKDMFVLYGGLGENDKALGDLWVYNLKGKNWTQLSKTGPGLRGHPGVWCFGSFMYIFGGIGNNGQLLNDLWKFNLPSLEWTLIQPSTSYKSYLPESRNGPATWISDGAFYMSGGNTAASFSYSIQLTEGLTSDLWRYFPCNSTWEYVIDPSNTTRKGIHSRKQMVTNNPSPRIGAGSWSDSSGNLWLFGGAGIENHATMANKHSHVLSDLWRFSLKLKIWMFVTGSSESNQAGLYGALGKETEKGMPGGRTEMMVFPGSDSKTYIFGGVGHDSRKVDGFLNDLWSVDVGVVLAGKYRISTWSVLLFLGLGVSLLLLILVIGLWDRLFKGFDLHNRSPMFGGPMQQYRKLENNSDI